MVKISEKKRIYALTVWSVTREHIPFDLRVDHGQTQLSQHTVSHYSSTLGTLLNRTRRFFPSGELMAETIASTNCTYPRRDGQAEWHG